MKVIQRDCETCKRSFNAPVREVKRGNGRFCSLSCSSKRTKTKEPNCQCAYCDTEIYKFPSKIAASKSGLVFCDRACKEQAQKIGGLKAIQPAHYGTSTSTQYRKLAFRELPNQCNRCSYCQHPEVLEVHHLDRNRDNNLIENLEILCPTCHRAEHFLAGDGRWSKN